MRSELLVPFFFGRATAFAAGRARVFHFAFVVFDPEDVAAERVFDFEFVPFRTFRSHGDLDAFFRFARCRDRRLDFVEVRLQAVCRAVDAVVVGAARLHRDLERVGGLLGLASPAFSFWLKKAGSAIAARIPRMSMTTRSSISVKPASLSPLSRAPTLARRFWTNISDLLWSSHLRQSPVASQPRGVCRPRWKPGRLPEGSPVGFAPPPHDGFAFGTEALADSSQPRHRQHRRGLDP